MRLHSSGLCDYCVFWTGYKYSSTTFWVILLTDVTESQIRHRNLLQREEETGLPAGAAWLSHFNYRLVFSERERLLYAIARPSVVCLSVCL